jgi:predicted RNase H-like nuclease (RuvC/YqgF family)
MFERVIKKLQMSAWKQTRDRLGQTKSRSSLSDAAIEEIDEITEAIAALESHEALKSEVKRLNVENGKLRARVEKLDREATEQFIELHGLGPSDFEE